MAKDSILFYYYSMPELPDYCYLKLKHEVAYRNMLMFPSSQDVIHFELPVFEDHSYNTICNRDGLKSLIKRPCENEKYIIFQTRSNGKKYIIGYYRIGREFYYESKMWDNYGFVWGIESSKVHLLKKDELEYTGQKIPRTAVRSWGPNDKWSPILEELINQISSRPNIASLYQSETQRLVSIFQNPKKLQEWREQCSRCGNRKCTFFNRNRDYQKGTPHSDLISVIQHAYSSNLYSRTELQKLEKHYLK
jgi:hypothetical protein